MNAQEYQEKEEMPVIPSTNTVVDPGTMVVKRLQQINYQFNG